MEDSKTPFAQQRPQLNAQMAACHQLLAITRWGMKWFQIPKLIIHWFAVLVKLKPQPQPVMMNAIKAQDEIVKAKAAGPKIVIDVESPMDNVVSMNESKT